MRRVLHQFIDRLPAPAGIRLDRHLRSSGIKRAQFVSFLESSGYRTRHFDSYERGLKRRRLVKVAAFWLLAVGAAWFAIESAKALVIL